MFDKIFRVGHVEPLCMFNENIQSWSCGPSMHVRIDFQSWSSETSMINKIVIVGHVDPLCMVNENYSELVMWTLYACSMKISRVGHMDPLCMFNENFQSLSYGPSMHV